MNDPRAKRIRALHDACAPGRWLLAAPRGDADPHGEGAPPPTARLGALSLWCGASTRARWLQHSDVQIVSPPRADGTPGTTTLRWDARMQQAEVARDRPGVEIVCIAEDTHGWWLSSDPGLALDAAGLPWRPNRARLSRFLLMEDDDGADDFLEGVCRLRPGERWCARAGHAQIIPAPPWPATGGLLEARDVQALSVRLESTLRAQLDTIARPRVFTLSGGLDASTLVALSGERPARVVTMGFDSAPDETRPSAELAAALGAEQTRVAVDRALPLSDLTTHQHDPALGPHFHPGEGYEAALYEAVAARYPGHALITGMGADHLLSIPLAALWRWQLEHGTAQTRARMAYARPGATARLAVREGLRALGALEAIRAARPAPPQRSAPWTDPARWVRQPAAPLEASDDPREGLLTGWRWELVMRALIRQQRRGHTMLAHPFMSEAVWALLWPLSPAVLRTTAQDKSALRLIAARHTPAALAWRDKIPGFDAANTRALTRTHAATARALLTDSALHAHDLIDTRALVPIFDQMVQVSARPGAEARLLALWRVLAAELWWRALP